MELEVSSFLLMLGIYFFGFMFGSYERKVRLPTKEKYQRHLSETYVANQIERYLDFSCERLINNVTLQLDDGSTTQIDHILISTKGITVIESKHYKGFIFANEKSKNWTQVYFKKKHQFQNPIRQNYKHVKAIEALFDFIPNSSISSLVIFSGSAEFKTQMPRNVSYLNDIVTALNERPGNLISLNRVELCYGRLQMQRLPETNDTDRKHIQNLHSRFWEVQN